MFIYITGRGKSGSTILDIALSQSDQVIGLGELLSGLNKNKTCSCGKPAKLCKKWKYVHSNSELSKANFKYLKKQSVVTNFLKYFVCSDKAFFKKSMKYLQINNLILESRLKACDGYVLVDSSKEVTRGLIIGRAIRNSLTIHLIRDPYNLISSNLHRVDDGSGLRFMRINIKNKKLRPFFLILIAFGWVLGNLLCEISKYRTKGKRIKIRFEDICLNPDQVIGRIESLAGVDLTKTKLFLRGQSVANDIHILGGNRTKMEKNLTFNPVKAQGRNILTRTERFIAMLIVGPMRKLYGY